MASGRGLARVDVSAPALVRTFLSDRNGLTQ
jgi:hypothetical protein